MHQEKHWTHPSVLALAGQADPVEAILQLCRDLVYDAMEAGITGPPFDPLALAAHQGIPVVPSEDIRDARTVPIGGKKVRIEFNPNQSRGRMRYSLAHEIVHTLFPDCAEQVRNRVAKREMRENEWQLEVLCNLGAAELLMPIGSFPNLAEEEFSIDNLLRLRRDYDVSTEAILIRAVNLTEEPCFVFCASRIEQGSLEGRYVLDYAISSRSWKSLPTRGAFLPHDSHAAECTAIGFTAKGTENWGGSVGSVGTEYVGIPPYPGRRYPRVAGIAQPSQKVAGSKNRIQYLIGDALEPRGSGAKILAHIVNDKALLWGGGFALNVRRKWPSVQEDFQAWGAENSGSFKLGESHLAQAPSSMFVFNMIAQHGYGKSAKPRIRYAALERCLTGLAALAIEKKASVHMPRIGCGQAGGSWSAVSELIDLHLVRRGVAVTVYDLPNQVKGNFDQANLFVGK